MKNFITISLLFLCLHAAATNYYISASGSDAANGTTTSTPWQTLAKFNSTFSSRVAGDSVLFHRGDTFYGSITLSAAGSAGNPIVIGAYGTGADPVISGFSTVGAWTNLGSNIWESTSAISTLSHANLVTINGVNTAMGRYPNTGYLQYQSFSTNTTITSSFLSGTPNWTGAEMVFKPQKYILSRNVITGQSTGTLTYTAGTGVAYTNGQSYNGTNNFGFFTQNDSRTLDTANEWYYDPSSKKIDVYSTSQPVNVQVTTVDTLVFMPNGQSNVTFDHIHFTGANDRVFHIFNSPNVTIQYCTFDYCFNGVEGFNNGGSSTHFLMNHCLFNHFNNNAADLPSEFTNDTIQYNVFKNCGLLPGMGGSGDGKYQGITVKSTGECVRYNEVDSIGYNGIVFQGNNANISYNLVTYACMIKDDGGGIYTQSPYSGQIVQGNIVIGNGVGALDGTPNGFPGGNQLPADVGIYCDDGATVSQILENSIANVGFSGLFLHNNKNTTVKRNTIYNAAFLFIIKNNNSDSIRNIDVEGNFLLAKDSTQILVQAFTSKNDIAKFGRIDLNYYSRPLLDSLVFDAVPDGNTHTFYTLAGWRTYSGYDLVSHKSPVTVSTAADTRFDYNWTGSPVTVTLPYNFSEVSGKSHNGSVILPAYSSAALIKVGPVLSNKGNLNCNCKP